MFSRTTVTALCSKPVFVLRATTRHLYDKAALASTGFPSLAGTANEGWWSQTGSNRRPHACKARALPAELWPRNQKTNAAARSPSLKLRRSSLHFRWLAQPKQREGWWAWEDLNFRP